jgi:glucose/arabinose dehydrogenase
MRSLTLAVGLALLGCGKAEAPPADAAPPATAGLSLADLAGTWSMQNVLEDSARTVVSYEIMATADPQGWMLHLPNRPPLPLTATVGGDSLVTEAGPFESVLRPGVQVRTRSVVRLVDGKLTGRFVARYEGAGADSMAAGSVEGSRKP